MAKNKKVFSFAAMILVFALGIGVTYAWFTRTVSAETVIKLGTLGIEGVFEDNDRIFEPGETSTTEGIVKNTGNLDAILNFNKALSVKYSWNNYYEELDNDLLDIEIQGNYGIIVDGDGAPLGAWLYNVNDESDIYLMIVPGAEVEVGMSVYLDGTVLDDEFQDAHLKAETVMKGTQVKPEAVLAELGVDMNDLEFFPEPLMARSASYSAARAYFEELLGR